MTETSLFPQPINTTVAFAAIVARNYALKAQFRLNNPFFASCWAENNGYRDASRHDKEDDLFSNDVLFPGPFQLTLRFSSPTIQAAQIVSTHLDRVDGGLRAAVFQ